MTWFGKVRKLLWTTVGLALTVLWALPANGATTCDACHSAPSMKQAHVTQASLAGSAHEKTVCTDCHTGLSGQTTGHPIPLPLVDCRRCHSAGSASGAMPVDPTRHGRSGKDAGPKPRCATCHGSHQILPPDKAGSSVGRQNIVETCAVCHGPRGSAAKATGDRQVLEYRGSVHGKPDPKRRGLYAAVCYDCHGNHVILPASDPESRVNKHNVPKVCGACHKQEHKDYSDGIHGSALARGINDAASCTDCHGEHSILAPKDSASKVSRERVVETCSRCHANKNLIRKYNLPVGRVESYRESFHGVANRFGEIDVASCASCHGAHLVLPQRDPRSSVHPANLPKTCGQPDCHPGAGINFAKGNVHLNPTPRSDKAVYWVTLLYTIFIWALIAQFVGLIALDLVQHGRRGWKAHEPEPSRPHDQVKVVRFTRNQLYQHWTLITSFTLLVITGLPLRFADSAASGWVIKLLGGMTFRGNLHRIAAAVLVGVCIWHLLWTIFTKRGRADFVNMLPKPRDIGRAIGMLKYYFGLAMEMPGFGRFNLIEKFEYLAMGWGSVVMIITGLALWFPEVALRVIPKWGLDICHVVHGYEAVLAFLAITIWHFYHVHWKPGMFPMSRVWLDGEVTLSEMRHEHRQEYDRLTRELAAKHASGQLEEATPEEVRRTTDEIESNPSPDTEDNG